MTNSCAIKGVVLLKPEALDRIVELYGQHQNLPDQLDNILVYLFGVNKDHIIESHFRNNEFADPAFNNFDIEQGCISFISGFDESKLLSFLSAVEHVSSSHIIYCSAEDKFRVDNLSYHIKALDLLNHRTSDFVSPDMEVESQAFDFSAVNGSGEYCYRDTSQLSTDADEENTSQWIQFYKINYGRGFDLYSGGGNLRRKMLQQLGVDTDKLTENERLSLIALGATGSGKSSFFDSIFSQSSINKGDNNEEIS